jgi:hypothetical protein
MKVIFYVSVPDFYRLQRGEAVRAMESEASDFYRIEAEIGEVELYQDPAVNTRQLVKKITDKASSTSTATE